ncbi:motility associated factor glycosyltransferase family protein [Campylobacter jejuni]|uniref:motility associated factor glycosyltransferase family protein n=5 Tax=Campylobacter jejuni TaxID=197 RepID=UPI0016566D7B|nr:motility associated factor glycosyltransferase family protein [Campylobacter jejuni]ECO9846551.1 motility associated factor glycosyltransferase family protein [Campylobacter jejuni]EHE6659438.1 motility associated factor glycosyltransferase family protein [Campylobacter jejuni]EHV9447135.1 motility associated factor glycosyltransferase family protein [Campylobacter jejuni]MBC8762153.1 motility associated factor glycosyltransferase family protein [Campylobacter jejuni]MBC8765945.1 motility a
MTFTPTQKQLFNKNIEALSNILLKESLKEIKSSKFELILGKDNLDINLKDTSDNTFLYENVIDELNSMLNTYNDKYLLYPVLYFYGFGNGILFKALLQNKNHQHIVVFEKNIEIIWIMFHILDFSNELQSARLMVLETSSLNIEFFSNFCSNKPFFQFSRIYFLELMSHYYERFHEDILGLNKKLAENFKNSIVSHGNDPLDALQGIEQFVYNLPQMITHPSYKELLSKRKGISDTAIIVSTGPSLTKQLPLLKKYASKATIFCADSSYPILAKHGIKPDYVCMLERDEIVAECFNNDFKDFDKDIIFLVASLVHKKTISYLEKNKRKYMLIIKGQPFARYLELDDYGYINAGMSVSHMAYELAENLGHKNIILIGQDLAYAKDGQTHSQGFIHANLHNGDYERDLDRFSTTAYGGNGKVQSSEIWTLFRQIFENFIAFSKSKTYNCTEGGARIESAIEKPFKELCENLLENKKDKKFKKLQVLNTKEQVELGLKIYQKIKKNMNLSLNFKKECKKVQKQIHNLTHGKNKLSLEQINQNIDKIKEKLSNKKYLFLQEILGPTLHHEQSILTPLYLKDIKDDSDKQNKLFAWVYAHESLMENIVELLETQDKRLKIAILPLQDFLEKKKAL